MEGFAVDRSFGFDRPTSTACLSLSPSASRDRSQHIERVDTRTLCVAHEVRSRGFPQMETSPGLTFLDEQGRPSRYPDQASIDPNLLWHQPAGDTRIGSCVRR
jgi:hypothetical protein